MRECSRRPTIGVDEAVHLHHDPPWSTRGVRVLAGNERDHAEVQGVRCHEHAAEVPWHSVPGEGIEQAVRSPAKTGSHENIPMSS